MQKIILSYSYISKLWIFYALPAIINVHCLCSDFVAHLRQRGVGHDGRCQVRVDIVLTEPGLCVVFSILQCMTNYTWFVLLALFMVLIIAILNDAFWHGFLRQPTQSAQNTNHRMRRRSLVFRCYHGLSLRCHRCTATEPWLAIAATRPWNWTRAPLGGPEECVLGWRRHRGWARWPWSRVQSVNEDMSKDTTSIEAIR